MDARREMGGGDSPPLFFCARRTDGCVNAGRSVVAAPSQADDVNRRAAALQMRRRGISRREIGDRLGAAPSTVRGWLTDPDGSRARSRRAGYGARCECCGARTSGNRPGASRSRCRRCAGAGSRRWDRQKVVTSILEWRRRYGRWPTSSDWHATRARERGGTAWARWSSGIWPPASTVTRVFGRFSSALDAAVLRLEDRLYMN